jgi:DNA-binding PadR family transcriptional regulator
MFFRFGHHHHHAHHCHGPHGMGRGGGHPGFDPRSRSRMFEQGDLRFVVLKLLADKPAHGYEIIKRVEALFGGAYAPSPGIVYPTLTMLEEQGLIAVVESEGPRKLYGLTDAGRVELAGAQADVGRVFGRMDEMRRRYGGGDAPEIRRAMENLGAALRLRVARGDVDATQVTAILDEAARRLETL